MLLLLSKLLAVPVYPLGLAICCALASGLLAWFGRRKPAVALAAAAAVVLWVFSIQPVSNALLRILESRSPQLAGKPPAAAIVVLAGFGDPQLPPRTSPEIVEETDRLFYGARLFRQGLAPYLILTGGRIPWMRAVEETEAETGRNMLRELLGLDDTLHILLEDKARNTRNHAPLIAGILQARGLPKDIILVTSASHMYRAARIFRKAGYTVWTAPTDYQAPQEPFKLFKLLPQAIELRKSTQAMHEFYGIIAYRILGWI